MKYILSVEVKLQEVPEDPEPIEVKPAGDPMQVLADMANRVVVARQPAFMCGGSAGFEFRKAATVSVADFAGLADVVGKFDSLMHDIELGAIGAELQP